MAFDLRFTIFITSALIVAISLLRKRDKDRSQGEPLCVPSLIRIPWIGHLVGLCWFRTAYYSIISKVHVVSSPTLMNSLHRQPRIVSFWYMEAKFASKLSGMSETATRALEANLDVSEQENSLVIEGLRATKLAMSSRDGFAKMTRCVAALANTRLGELERAGGTSSVDLWAWVQQEITTVTTESIYGAQNPYRDPVVQSAFCDFAENTISLLLPKSIARILAPKAYAGRETLVQAMKSYFSNGAYEDSSALTSARQKIMEPHIDYEGMARFECVNGIAILANTVPTAFWTLFHIFSDSDTLAIVRKQVEEATSPQFSEERGKWIKNVDFRKIKDSSMIYPIIQETLRYRATGTGPRMVMEDTYVGEENYRLLKGSTVMIINHELHLHEETWGADAGRFVADRFCGKTPMHAFRGFGGGANHCPGKEFAMIEIMVLVVMLVARFDVLPSGGAWSEPGQNLSNMSLQIAPPAKQVMVEIAPRSSTQDVDWTFSF